MKSLKFYIPKTWNELNEWQFISIVRLLHTMAPGTKQDKAILKVLLNIRFWQFYKKMQLKILLSNVPLSQIKSHYQYIFKESDRSNFISALKIKGETYHPPMDRIINLTASEFAAADDLNNKFLQTRDPEYLHYLAAVLYTPLPRPVFNKLDLEAKAKTFKRLSEIKLIAIHICFSGCKNIIAQRFKKVFPKTNSKKQPKYGFGKVILQMCRQDLSKYDKITNINIYTFLEQFQDDIINASKKTK